MFQIPQRPPAPDRGESSSKLYEGGGEVVVHSSVQASHGSSPAGFPLK